MRGVSCVATAAAVAFLASNCAYNDYFENRVARYDIATEQARDEMIFTNIVRASRAEPLAFQQLGQIAGSSMTGGTLGLPSLIFGSQSGLPAATAALQNQVTFGASPGSLGFTPNSATTSGSTSFDITPAETKDFYRGLLLTVAPETLGFFSEQGIARETLFYLFTEKVSESKGGKVELYVNDPMSDGFAKFQAYVGLATKYGLSSEPTPGVAPARPRKSSGESGNSAQHEIEVGTGAEWRLCFDKTLWAPGTPFRNNRPICGSKEKLADERTVSFVDSAGVPTSLRVFPRSTFAIFQYLGRLVAEGDAGRIQLTTDEARGRPPLYDDVFFTVASGTGGARCFLFVNYAGHDYCVPEDGALNTKRILGLIAQLLALNTSVRDLTNIPQVRVIQ